MKPITSPANLNLKKDSIMNYLKLFLLLCLISFGVKSELNEVFKVASQKLNKVKDVVVLLPSKLPKHLIKYPVTSTEVSNTASSYYVTMYWGEAESGRWFAGMISGKKSSALYSHNTTPVKITDELVGYFRPVQCGGSCGPANLWFLYQDAAYSIQLKLPSSMSESEQLDNMLTLTKSMF